MSLDCDGNELRVGDTVTVRFRVLTVADGQAELIGLARNFDPERPYPLNPRLTLDPAAFARKEDGPADSLQPRKDPMHDHEMLEALHVAAAAPPGTIDNAIGQAKGAGVGFLAILQAIWAHRDDIAAAVAAIMALIGKINPPKP